MADRTRPFRELFAEPPRNGLTRPKAVRGSGTKMVNMGELFAHPRLRNASMDRVLLTGAEAERFTLQKGDLLFARQSLVLEGAGKCSIFLDDDEPVTFESHVTRVRLDLQKANPSYYYYYLQSHHGRAAIRSIVEQGAGASGIRGSDLAALEVLWHPQEEQTAIAHILSTLDDKIELNRRVSETLQAMARAVFKSWFVDFDPVRAKADGWRFEEIGRHVESSRGFSYDGASIAQGGVPFHNLNSIFEGGGYKFEGIKSLSGEFDDRCAVMPGDVIVANTEQGHDRLLLGSAALIPQRYGPRTPFSHHLFRVRVRRGSPLRPVYLLHLLNDPGMHDLISRYGNGTTVNMLPADALGLPRIAVPPSGLVARFEAVVLPLHHRAETAVIESESLCALRDALLPKLISGELRLRDAEQFMRTVA